MLSVSRPEQLGDRAPRGASRSESVRLNPGQVAPLGLVRSLRSVFFSISSHIAELGRENVHPVLLIDEAHLLHQDVLDHLHILANYEWDSKPLLSIVLVGLPEIRQRLALAKNRSLWSRVHTRISLGEASATDTAEYVGHRMKRAGADREIFNADSVAIVHEHAQGRLREIDRICTDALKLAAKKKARVVDREIVARVIEEDVDDLVDD